MKVYEDGTLYDLKVGDIVVNDLTGNVCEVVMISDRLPPNIGRVLMLITKFGTLEHCYEWEVSEAL